MTTPVGRVRRTDIELADDGHLLRLIAGGVSSGGSRAAARRESRYRRFLDALGVAVYTTDAAGGITFYNEAAAEFWGRRPALGEEWCGSLRIYTPEGEWMPHDQCPMAIALRENRPVRGAEAIAERPDGSRVWFQPYPTPLRDDDGRLVGAVNVLVDVTDRHQAQEQLDRASTALAASTAIKDDFLGLVSHELRTPVTTIFGNARLLQDRGGSLDEATKASMIGDIAEDAERLHAIIENLLQLTRLGSGAVPDLEPQIVERVVRRTVESFGRRHPLRPVSLTGEARAVIVEADATWLELVVENLLANANKYSPAGSPVDVHLEVRPGEVEVVVRDRGVGLGDVTPEDMFEPFFRGATARTTANGVGIGLAVCRRIVAALGGQIWARERPGGGSEVGFCLPTASATEDDARA